MTEEFPSYYPPKPTIERREANSHISITVLSVIIFALTFSIITDDYLLIGTLIAVLFFHELGHFLVMKVFGYEKLSMIFIPFIGAMVSGKKKLYSQIESSLMLMAGPVPGIIVGYFLLDYGVTNEISLALETGTILILLNVMNLIPIDPLDGGKLLNTLFVRNYEQIQLVFSIITSIGLVIIGIWLNSWIFTAFGIFSGFRIKSKHKLFLIRKESRKANLRYEANYEDLSDQTYQQLRRIVETHRPELYDVQDNSSEAKYDQIVARQVDRILIPPTNYDASAIYKTLVFLIWAGSIALAIHTFLNIDLNLLIDAFQNR
jgi:Zn-dependent protease